MKTAFVTGITGQDGMHISRLLQAKSYIVHGLVRPKNIYDWTIIKAFPQKVLKGITLHQSDIRNYRKIERIIRLLKPDEIYHLAAQTNVELAEEKPLQSYEINTLGTINLLESVYKNSPKTKLFYAGSILQFHLEGTINEESIRAPLSVYGQTKQIAYNCLEYYRNRHNLFYTCGFLSGHESILRKDGALSRYIISKIIQYYKNEISDFSLFDISKKRYWGHASEYVDAMWRILQQSDPKDYIIAPNESYSIRDFCSAAFSHLNIDIEWREVEGRYHGFFNNMKVIEDSSTAVNMEESYTLENFRARQELKWEPTTSISKLTKEMLEERLQSKY